MAIPNTAPIANDDTFTGPVVGDFPVNEITTDRQRTPAVTELSTGQIVVAWWSYDGVDDTSATSIKARIFNPDGTEVVGEFLVNSTVLNRQEYPGVAALEDGKFVVTWFSTDGIDDPSSTSTKARIFNSNGVPLGDEFLVNESTNNRQDYGRVAALEDGGFAIAWHTLDSSDDTSIFGIKARVFNEDGTPLAGEFPVNQFTLGYQTDPKLAGLENGQFVVTWIDRYSKSIARVYDADGTPAADEFEVGGGFAPYAAAMGDDSFIIVWGNDRINAKIFSDNGTTVEANFTVSSSGTHPTVDILEDGSFVVSWDSSSEVFARVYRPDNTPAGVAFVVNEIQGGHQLTPVITGLASGGFLIVWDSSDRVFDPFVSGINARFFNADGTPATGALTDEDTPHVFTAADLLANDTDPDGDTLNVSTVSATSAQGAGVTFNADGTITYDPVPSAALAALNQSDMLQDSFTYTVTDGDLTDTATVLVTVLGRDDFGDTFAQDDDVTVSADMLGLYGTDWFRLGAVNNRTDLLENDLGAEEIIQVNGAPFTPGLWFDGDGGGQFRVYPSGVVDFRNQGAVIADGDKTGFSYTGSDGTVQDLATVSLRIDTAADIAKDDEFEVTYGALAASGQRWFRLGALNNHTDLLENDPGVDELIFVDGLPIQEGVWFDSEGGGQFRVFSGGVVDFRNQGDAVTVGDTAEFFYSVVDDRGTRDTARVSMTVAKDTVENTAPYFVSDNLLFWNTFDDFEALNNSAVGPDSILIGSNIEFQASQHGTGFIRTNRDSHVELPKAILGDLGAAGTVEMWITPLHPIQWAMPMESTG